MKLAEMKVEKDKFQITELGKFPKEWSLISLENCCTKITDGTHDTPQKVSHGIPYITAIHVKEEGIDFDNCYYLSEEAHRSIYRRCNPEYHDVLMVNIGAGVGTTSIVDVDYEFSLKNVALLKPKNRVTSGTYLNFVLTHFKTQIISKLLSGGAQDFLSLSKISDIKIPLPPTLKEQQAIAEALSDVDALIAELDALIEKKQQVKKGAMQQLLTGKKRLPRFDGEWEKKRLEEIGNTYNGLSGKSGADFGDGNHPYIPFLNVMNNPVINTSHFDTVKIKSGESQSTAEKGDLFFNTSSETPEEVGMCSVLLEDVENLHLNSFCFGFRLFGEKETVPLFLAYYFRSQYGREHMKSLAQGSTRYNLSKSKFVNIEVALPPYEEQKAIAQILSDMDAEIQSLQAKRAKYEQIKQGMMQELLTGKTRLVE